MGMIGRHTGTDERGKQMMIGESRKLVQSPEKKMIGPFQLVKRLGQGGMGIVYLAEHIETSEKVALKTVRVAQQGYLQSIRREIRALQRINHPGIVSIVAEGVADGLPWYAMEFVSGTVLQVYVNRALFDGTNGSPTLAEAVVEGSGSVRGRSLDRDGETWWTRSFEQATAETKNQNNHALQTDSSAGDQSASGFGHPAPTELVELSETALKTVLAVCRRVCNTLAYMHGEGVIHRDLKPDNILIRPNGEPVIVDFGLLSHYGGMIHREALQIDANVMGTVPYMAPEQIRGDLVDARADLYALGCILFQLLTGRLPFIKATPFEVLQAHLFEEPPPPSRLCSNSYIQPELDDLVLSLLAKNPQQRIGYAQDVARQLAAISGDVWLPEPEPRPRAYIYRPAFIGREPQLQIFTDRFDNLVREQGSLVMVGGESGIGKTRFMVEVGRKAAQRGILVLSGESLDAGAQPLEPLRKTLQFIADRCREGGVAETTRLLGPRAKVIQPFEDSLTDLPGLETYPEPAELPPEAARIRLFTCLWQTIAVLSQDVPLVLILDDLQWVDDLTIHFLQFLLQSGNLPQSRILVIGTFRTEEVGPGLESLLTLPELTLLRLSRLEEQEVNEILSNMLAMNAPPPILRHHLVRHSEGNPLFVAEYVKAAVEQKLLFRDDHGMWQVMTSETQGSQDAVEKQYQDLPLPRSLRDLVRRRLAELPDIARAIIDIAGLYGRESPIALLRHLSERGETIFLQGLDALVLKQVLEESAPEQVRFVHDKIREVIIAEQDVSWRKNLHQSLAQGIEDLFAEQKEEYLARLSWHWDQAGQLTKAQSYYLAAARQARNKYAYNEARASFQAYLERVVEPTSESVQAQIELVEHVLMIQGAHSEARATLDQALANARKLGNKKAEITCLIIFARLHQTLGQPDPAQEMIDNALILAREIGNRREEGTALSSSAYIQYRQGHTRESLALYSQSLTISREVNDRFLESQNLGNLGVQYHVLGEIDLARQHYEHAVCICREIGNRRLEAGWLSHIALLHYDQGRIEQALSLARDVLAMHVETGDCFLEEQTIGNMGVFLENSGKPAEAYEYYQRALKIARQNAQLQEQALNLGNMANVKNTLGLYSEAISLFEQALEKITLTKNKRLEAMILGNMANSLLAEGYIERAWEACNTALSMIEKTKYALYEAIIVQYMARIDLFKTRKIQPAAEFLLTSEAIFRKLGARAELGKNICQQGHLAIARGCSAAEYLEQARKIIDELQLTPTTPLAVLFQKLKRAQNAFEKQDYHRLLCGELADDIPPKCRQYLLKKPPGPEFSPAR